jgi:hypothetical protein
MKEKHHWMFPLHANHLQHLYLILCNDVDCKVIEIIIKMICSEPKNSDLNNNIHPFLSVGGAVVNKIKKSPVLKLIKHYVMKAYGGMDV